MYTLMYTGAMLNHAIIYVHAEPRVRLTMIPRQQIILDLKLRTHFYHKLPYPYLAQVWVRTEFEISNVNAESQKDITMGKPANYAVAKGRQVGIFLT